MKNVKSNLGSFAQAKNAVGFFSTKLQAKRHSLLAITLILTVMVLSMCSKKAEAQESKKSSATGSAKTEAYNSESDFQIDWDENVKDGIVIVKYIGINNVVNIPPRIQNSPVTRIGYHAFKDNKNITSVTIPYGVISIDIASFENCTSLTNVTIPDSVTDIQKSAFSQCTSLTSITIPNSVTVILDFTFSYCTSLTSITIPDSVTRIYDYAFRYCTSLTNITIPKSVTDIGQSAFTGYTGLTVTIEGKDVGISSTAFGGTDLPEKYRASDGGPGTYKRFAGGTTWKKQ